MLTIELYEKGYYNYCVDISILESFYQAVIRYNIPQYIGIIVDNQDFKYKKKVKE